MIYLFILSPKNIHPITPYTLPFNIHGFCIRGIITKQIPRKYWNFTVFEDSFSGNNYIDILRNLVPEITEDVPLACLNNLFLQQDGVPAHNAQIVETYLDNNLPYRIYIRFGLFLWRYQQNCKQKYNIRQCKSLKKILLKRPSET